MGYKQSPILNENKLKLGFFSANCSRGGHSRREDLIVRALARVPLNGSISNVQVSRVKLGFHGALACLCAGANDFNGTLMEESISKAAGANFGKSVLPGELRAMIRSIGHIPAERSTAYKIRKVFEQADYDERWPEKRLQREPLLILTPPACSPRGNRILMDITALAGAIGASKPLREWRSDPGRHADGRSPWASQPHGCRRKVGWKA